MPGHPMRRREFMRSAATLALAAAGYPKLVLKSLANESKSTIAFETVSYTHLDVYKRQYYNSLLRNKGDGTFEDVTEKAGLTGANLGYSFGVAAGDYDNDGNEDLFITNAGRNTLYHNNGDGTFTDVTEGSGLEHKPANVISVGAAWFDYDNDGLLDLSLIHI